MKKYLVATDNFKPNDPSTHVKYHYKSTGVQVLIIETPDKKLVPYNPKDHNDENQETGILAGHTMQKMFYKTYRGKVSKKCALANPVEEAPKVPTQEEIDIFKSKKIDAYLAEGFDPSKGDANTKWDRALGHTRNTEILVLQEKMFGGAYKPYVPSKHSTNSDDYKSITKSITVNNYRTTRHNTQSAYAEFLEKKNNSIATFTETRDPTQEEIDIIDSRGVDAYVAAGFDPNKGDANEKYDSRKHALDVQIVILKKKIFGGGCEPYNPKKHGTNLNDFKSIEAASYCNARSKARKIYEQWKNTRSATTSTTTTTTSSSIITYPATSNEVVGPKHFNPIILIRDSDQVSEDKEQGTDNHVTAPQTGSTSQQRKRVADDSVLNSTPSLTGSSSTLFQGNVPAVPKDPTQPKRFRPWE